MTEEELIIAVAAEAREIPPVAYKLLWGLISLAIQRGSGVVQVSQSWLALYIGASRAGIAIAIRQLEKYVEVDNLSTKVTTFRLPESWLPSQGPLFGGDGPITSRRPRLSTVITTSPPPAPSMSKGQAKDQASACSISRHLLPITSLEPRLRLPGIQANLVHPVSNYVQDIEMGTRARVESSRVEVTAEEEEYLVVEKAFHTVEIRANQLEDARILTEILQSYRSHFDSSARAASRPDRKVLARLLAIGSLEEIADTLNERLAMGRKPGESDMWFFFVLLDKLRGIDHKLTASVIEQAKSKAPFNESRGALFEDQLLAEVNAKARRLA